MGRKSTTVTGSALTSITAVNRTTTPKTRAVTGSGTRIKTKEEPRTERGIEKGKKTRRETKSEKRQEIGILTETGKETRINEETEIKSGRKRENDTKRGKRGTKVERVAIERYAT